MDETRKAPFFAALGLIALALFFELGASWAVAVIVWIEQVLSGRPAQDISLNGYGIPALGFIDGLLLLGLSLTGLSLIAKQSTVARAQGFVAFVLALLGGLAAVAMIMALLTLICTMVGLLMAVPFGTIVYMVIWGHFPRAEAAIVLNTILLLKVGAAICLLVSQQRFLTNKGLVFLVLLSFGANLLVSFLHALPPGILASITDVIAAVVLVIVGFVCAIVLFLGSLPSIVKALKPAQLSDEH